MPRLTLLGMCSLAFLVSACAGISVTAVPNTQTDADARGFRYYESAPFLLMYTDGKGGLTSKVIYLPDMTKKRSILPYNYLASNNTTLTFADGKLSGAKSVIDETVVPTAIVSALEKIATSAIKAANAENDIPGPYLYRIVKQNNVWQLKGDQGAMIRYLPQ